MSNRFGRYKSILQGKRIRERTPVITWSLVSEHLVTVEKKNLPLTRRRSQQNQAQGVWSSRYCYEASSKELSSLWCSEHSELWQRGATGRRRVARLRLWQVEWQKITKFKVDWLKGSRQDDWTRAITSALSLAAWEMEQTSSRDLPYCTNV